MDAEEKRLEGLLDKELAKNKKGTRKVEKKKPSKSKNLKKDPSKIMYSDWFPEEGEERYLLIRLIPDIPG